MTRGTGLGSRRLFLHRWQTAAVAKYDPLLRRLCDAPAASVELSFDEIGHLVGGLPPSAFTHRAWWGNEVDGRHVQAAAWTNAGRSVEQVDVSSRRVRFGPVTWRRGS